MGYLFLPQLSRECSKVAMGPCCWCLLVYCRQSDQLMNSSSAQLLSVLTAGDNGRGLLCLTLLLQRQTEAGSASMPTMHLSVCYCEFQSCGCIWRITQQGHPKTHFYLVLAIQEHSYDILLQLEETQGHPSTVSIPLYDSHFSRNFVLGYLICT